MTWLKIIIDMYKFLFCKVLGQIQNRLEGLDLAQTDKGYGISVIEGKGIRRIDLKNKKNGISEVCIGEMGKEVMKKDLARVSRNST